MMHDACCIIDTFYLAVPVQLSLSHFSTTPMAKYNIFDGIPVDLRTHMHLDSKPCEYECKYDRETNVTYLYIDKIIKDKQMKKNRQRFVDDVRLSIPCRNLENVNAYDAKTKKPLFVF